MVGLSTSLGLYLGSRKASISAPPPFSPTDLPSLDLWLNADHNIYGGGSRQFTSANLESFRLASFAEVNLGTGDFSISLAFNRTTSGNQVIAAKRQDLSNYWRLEFTATNVLHFIAVIGGATLIEVTGTTAITTAGWHTAALNVDRDATATTRLYLNGVNDTAGTPTVSVSTVDNTGVFALGENVAASLFWNGKLARFGVLKNDLLSTTEITFLHNNKNSRLYGELGVAGTDGSGLTNFSFWLNLNEPSGNAIDAVSTNDLTDNNTVTAADGPGEDIAADSIGTNHGTLVNFPAGGVAWSSDKPTGSSLDGSLTFDGVNDVVLCGSIGNVTAVSFNIKSLVVNQEIMALANTTATAVTVAAGVLTFGASLAASAITVDGVSKTAAEAGALINDGAWHTVAFNLTSISATDLRLGTDGTAFGNIRLQAVSFNADALALYNLDDGPQTGLVDGDPVIDWRAHAGTHIGKQHLQATYAKRPLFRSAGINSKAAVDFDGTDDLLVNPTAYLTGTQGEVWIVYRLDAIPGQFQAAISSADEASGVRYFSLLGRGNTPNPFVRYEQQNSDTADFLNGDTAIIANTDYCARYFSDGLILALEVNGVTQTIAIISGVNSGDWFDDTTAKDNVCIGGLKRTTEGNIFVGKIRHILVFNEKLSDADALLVRQYLADDAGITL